MTADVDPGEVGERRAVGGDHDPTRCLRRRRDHEVVGPARFALAANLDEELGMSFGHTEVIGDEGNDGEDVVHEGCSRRTGLPAGQQDPDPELGDGDRSHGDVVVVIDDVVEPIAGSVGVDEKGRVEEEATQGRSSISTRPRTADSSSAHLGSRR